jgi:endonuclease-3
MKESAIKKQERAKIILRKLKRYYPDAKCALNHSNPLELLVATILSAQCTDERVNIVTKSLFEHFRRAEDYAKAPVEKIEDEIRTVNFFRNKAKALKGMGQRLVEEHNGEVPRELDELVKLPGVGRKTANVVLGNAFHIALGIVVDTHVKRVAYRLGLTSATTPEKVELDLHTLIPKSDWILISHLFIFHGRQICKARRPLCEKCPLEGDCPKKGVTKTKA